SLRAGCQPFCWSARTSASASGRSRVIVGSRMLAANDVGGVDPRGGARRRHERARRRRHAGHLSVAARLRRLARRRQRHQHDGAHPRRRRRLLGMALPSLVGGALGALLVLWVGNRTFARVVPWLIYGATLLFVAQAPLRRWLDRRIGSDAHRRRRVLQVLMQFAISIYGGFFGAAMG